MTDKKRIKRAIDGVWDSVKTLRSERRKSYGLTDVNAAADQLEAQAVVLRKLGQELSALSPMPPMEPSQGDAPTRKPRKRTRKKA